MTMTKHGNSKYPAEVKLAFALGIERKMFDTNYLKTIPYATRSLWRKKDPVQFANQLDSVSTSPEIKKFLQQQKMQERQNNFMKKAFMKFNEFLIESMGEKEYLKFMEKHKTEFVNWVNDQQPELSKKDLLEIARIKKSRFKYWQAEVQFNCTESALSKCARTTSQQITLHEALTIMKVVREGDSNLNAIWANSIREGSLALSRSTFYKYTKIFGLASPIKNKVIKKRSKIRASKPNEIWHADITQVETLNGQKSYIYAVMDNYSRAILSYRVEKRIRGHYSLSVLKDAFLRGTPEQLLYITDGGSENKTTQLRSFIKNATKNMQHIIARKDIKESNSMIERIFRTMKSEFPKMLNAEDHIDLKLRTKEVVESYNQRPHCEHIIYTPMEVLRGQDGWLDLKNHLRVGYEKRIKTNRNCACNQCDCGQEATAA